MPLAGPFQTDAIIIEAWSQRRTLVPGDAVRDRVILVTPSGSSTGRRPVPPGNETS